MNSCISYHETDSGENSKFNFNNLFGENVFMAYFNLERQLYTPLNFKWRISMGLGLKEWVWHLGLHDLKK